MKQKNVGGPDSEVMRTGVSGQWLVAIGEKEEAGAWCPMSEGKEELPTTQHRCQGRNSEWGNRGWGRFLAMIDSR